MELLKDETKVVHPRRLKGPDRALLTAIRLQRESLMWLIDRYEKAWIEAQVGADPDDLDLWITDLREALLYGGNSDLWNIDLSEEPPPAVAPVELA